MEIEQLRQELNHLLESIVERSNKLSRERKITPLEIDVVLAKVNKLQENLVILRHLLQTKEEKTAIKMEETPKEEILKEEEHEEDKEEINFLPENNNPHHAIAGQLNKKTITKLINSFSLNDRYLYANELFHKDMNEFNTFITTIDNAPTLAEAQTLIQQIQQIYNWEEENERVEEIMHLLKKKFA